jgi:hypothetical protein
MWYQWMQPGITAAKHREVQGFSSQGTTESGWHEEGTTSFAASPDIANLAWRLLLPQFNGNIVIDAANSYEKFELLWNISCRICRIKWILVGEKGQDVVTCKVVSYK